MNLKGTHGPSHWQRVRENGLRLAKATKADSQMIELLHFFTIAQEKTTELILSTGRELLNSP
ncbi:MAG: hypothetical protein AAF585_09035 [Verrucomicrobiota bacterium]